MATLGAAVSDPFSDSSSPTYAASVTVTPSGGATPMLSYDDLVKKWTDRGYPIAAAEGAARNMMRESGGDPTIPGDGGTSEGLFQHHGPRKDELEAYAKEQGKPWTDPDVQIDFAVKELKTKFPKLNAMMMTADDPGEVNTSFKTIFERPKDTGTNTGNIAFSPFAVSEYQGKKGTDLVHMSPADYLALSPELENPWADASGRSLRSSLDKGDAIEKVPTLTIKPSGDGSAEVTDQDGRHRALAAQEAGADVIPVAVQGGGKGPPLTELQGMQGKILPYDFKPVAPAASAAPVAQASPTAAPSAPLQPPAPAKGGIMSAIMPSAQAAELPALKAPVPPDADPGAAARAQAQQAHIAGRQASAEPQAKLGEPVEGNPFAEEGDHLGAPVGFDPTQQMGRLESFGSGLKDTAIGAANLVNRAIEAPLSYIPGVGPAVQQWQQGIDQSNQAREQQIQTQGGDNAYRMGGQIVGQTGLGLAAAPAMAAAGVGAAAMPAAVGALSGATQPTKTNSLRDMAWNAVLGAGAGAAAGGLTNALKAAVAPALGPLQKLLMGEGVRLTPGQMAGGIVQRIENKLASLPVVGDMMRAAEIRGIEDFNQAAVNRSLTDIGEKLPEGVTGREAIAFAKTKFTEAYNEVLPRMVGQMDSGLQNDLVKIATLGQSLPPAGRDELLGVLQNSVVSKFSQGGGISGKAAQEIGMELGNMAKTMGRSESPYTRQLGTGIGAIKDSIDRMMERANPTLAPVKDKIDAGYAKYKIVERAARMAGADVGLFTPSQLSNAALAKDTSKDKAAFARGAALMQDLADAAKGVLPRKVPDSGTAANYLMATGGSALYSPHTALGLLAAAAPYTKMGVGLANRMASPAGPVRNSLANLIGQSGPVLAPAGAVAATNALNGGGQ